MTMVRLMVPLLVAVMLGACATAGDDAQQGQEIAPYRDREAPIGSNIGARKRQPQTPEERAKAREEAERMMEDQLRRASSKQMP
jgi:serine protease inhibitor ecotin